MEPTAPPDAARAAGRQAPGPGACRPCRPARSTLARSALARLVGDVADFAETSWGREPVLRRAADPGAFADLLSERAVDELVAERGLRTPFVRVAKAGSTLPHHAFTAPGGLGAGVADQVSDDKLSALFSARLHDRAAGTAPRVAADHRLLPAAGRRPRPPGAGQRLRHPTAEPGLRRPLRRPRRLRAPGRGPQEVVDPRARPDLTAARPAVDRPPRRGPAGRGAGAGARDRPRARRRAVPPARLPALGHRPGRRHRPPDARRAQLDPVRRRRGAGGPGAASGSPTTRRHGGRCRWAPPWAATSSTSTWSASGCATRSTPWTPTTSHSACAPAVGTPSVLHPSVPSPSTRSPRP